ncbi:hypothetical protein Rhe02_08460 [Rhizocola hellebori]|uniref:Uncharacterized protein n=1 Tax=Rhizocola hellebori TaxID=1392758 RepID=A0A8J3Q3I1_9ACTN|nr:hypothetical protein [Rhizocola hellebori]GIH02779.1 hypothetical protein Rhe02_08460 [Rhizocola hellebori]
MASHPLQRLFDSSADLDNAVELTLAEGITLAEALREVDALLKQQPSVQSVLLIVGQQRAGVTSRTRIQWLRATDLRGTGDADNASPPRGSSGYVMLFFRCAVDGVRTYRVHLDGGAAPQCPNGHGPMELDR